LSQEASLKSNTIFDPQSGCVYQGPNDLEKLTPF